jgi:hypothetical protein
LLCPTWLRASEIGVLFRARSENRAVVVEDDSARSACSDVDAEDWNTASLLYELATQTCYAILLDRTWRKMAPADSVNVHGRHLRLAAGACQRDSMDLGSAL